MFSFARSVTAVASAFALVATGVVWLVAGPGAADEPPRRWVWEANLLENAGFEAGLQGWQTPASAPFTQVLVQPGLGGTGQALQITATNAGAQTRLDDDTRSLPTASAGVVYRATASVRPVQVAAGGSLVLTEWSKDWRAVQRVSAPFSASPGAWTWVPVSMRAKLDGSRLQVSVVSNALSRDQKWQADALSVRPGRWVEPVPAPSPTSSQAPSPSNAVGSPAPTESPTGSPTGSPSGSATTDSDGQATTDSGAYLPAVCGTWVLQQVSSVAELDRMRPQLDSALQTPSTRGLSIRAPWKSVDGDFSIFNRAREIAQSAGKPLSIRVMAGRHTPVRVYEAGAYSYLNARGERIPKPFSDSGEAGNPVFEREYRALVDSLAAWSRANGVRLLHLPWYGHLWAEIDNGSEIQASDGYSLDAWTTGHLRLLDIGIAASGRDLSVEFPMSGYWGGGGSAASKFFDRIVASTGDWSPRVFLQGNALGKYPFNPTGGRPIFIGGQMYDGGQYDWSSVYADALTRNTMYIEVYTSSFTNDADGSLAATVRSQAEVFDGLCAARR
jgi:hypothetical protein